MGIVNHTYDYPALFREGVAARIEKAERKLRELNDRAWQIAPAEYVEKKATGRR